MQKIIATIQQNDVGLAVVNLQDALFAMMKYGYISPMPAGEYPSEEDLQILSEKLKDERAHSLYGENTAQLVFYFQLQNGLGDVLRGVGVDEKTADMLNKFLKKEGLLDKDDTYSVQGVVSNQTGNPLKDFIVIAFDRDLRREQALGEQVITDNSGFYRINYVAKDFLASDAVGAAPDLLVRVFDQNKELIAQSPIRFNASRREVVDFTIDVKEDKPAHWSHLCEVILPLLAGQGNAKPNYTHGHHDTGIATDLLPSELTSEDIEFIVKDTGLDIDLIQAWITAYAMQKESIAELNDIYPKHLEAMQENGWEFLFAFSSLAVASSLKQLCSLTADVQERSWHNALIVGKVSEIEASELKILFDALHHLGKLKQLDSSQSPENSFAQLLSITSPEMPKDLALKVMPLFESTDNNSLDQILELRNDNNKTHINRFVQGVRLQDRLGNAPNVIKELMSHLGDDTETVDDLVKIPTSTYLDMAKQQNMGAGEAYAIQNKVELINPVLAIQSRLKGKELNLDGGLKKALTKFLDDEPDAAENIIQGKAKIGKNAKDHEKALKTIGTVMNLGGTIGIANHLFTNNLSDIAKLARKGRDYLNTYFLEVPTEELDVIDENVIGKVNSLIDIGLGWSIDRPMRVPSWWLDNPPQPTPAERENLPTFSGFFGDLDECICKPCESMLGQPAYLVDLLMLLSKSDTAFNEFSQRRGDILNLELSCENAEKEVQHIDLALRILEKNTPNITLPSQLPADDEAIEAAYAPLSTTAYPWSLPFNLKLTELRNYLDKLKINLLDIWGLVGSVSNEQKAAEVLGLHSLSIAENSINDWNLISNVGLPADVNVWQRYGLSAGNVSIIDPASAEKLQNQPVSDVLKRISVLLDRTGLTLDEFERVIATSFVKGTGKLIIDNRDKCKTSQMKLNTGIQSLEDVLGRLHQFVRLYKRIGNWNIETLDAVIQLVGGSLSSTTSNSTRIPLLEIGGIKALSEQYKLPIDVILEVAQTPHNYSNLPRSLNLTQMQFALLRKLTKFGEPATPFSFALFKKLLETAEALTKIQISLETLAEAVLTIQDLQSIDYVSESLIATKDIEDFKKELREVIKQADEKVTSLSSANEVIAELSKLLGSEDANKVVTAINQAGASKVNTRDFIDAANKTKLALTPLLQQIRSFGDIKLNLANADIKNIFHVEKKDNPDAKDRFRHLVKPIADILKEQALINTITAKLGISSQDAIALLTYRLPLSSTLQVMLLKESPTQAENAQLGKWVVQVLRLHIFVKTVALDSVALAAIDKIKFGNSQFDWRVLLDTATDDWQTHWQQLQDYLWLAQEAHLGKDLLQSVFKETVVNEAIKPVAVRLNLSLTLISELFALAGFTASTQQEIRNTTLLRKAFEICLMAKKLGGNKAQLEKLANTSNLSDAVKTVLELLKAKSTISAWPESVQKHKDSIRKARRDAIVAYHISLKNNSSADHIWKENDLYEYHLIDPMMQPCMKTTKVVEAIIATQLFTQRVLFGLEPNISASDELKQRWTWMRNYRVWEANKKVFLFPENWLYPELRDDKSSSFKLLESTLGQGELNEDSAKEAFGQFLDDVAQMGQIQTIGLYEDVAFDTQTPPKRTRRELYQIGKTQTTPYQYYWRKSSWLGYEWMEWLPWQKVDVEIQSDHLIIFVINGEVHLSWPRFELEELEVNKEKKSLTKVSMAWSRLSGNKWKAIKVANHKVVLNSMPFSDFQTGYAFRCFKQNQEIRIVGYAKAINKNLLDSVNGEILQDTPEVMTTELSNSIWSNYRFNDFLIYRSDSNYEIRGNQLGFVEGRPGTALIINIETWIKAKDSSGNIGYVNLGSSSTQKYRVWLYLTINGKEMGMRPYNAVIWNTQYEAENYNIGLPQMNVRAKVDIPSLNLSYIPGIELPISPTLPNVKRELKLKLVVEPRDPLPTLADMGIASTQDFIPVLEFRFDGTFIPQLNAASPSEIKIKKLSSGEIFLNGYKGNSNSFPLSFIDVTATPALQAFQSPYRLETTTNQSNSFFLLPASPVESNQGVLSDIWHYSDGKDSCFVDINPVASDNSTFEVFASGYTEAIFFNQRFKSNEEMFVKSQIAPMYFTANGLPNIVSNSISSTWQKQLNGSSGFDLRLPYACYNWEVFFHAPLMIADQLSKQQKFEEAEHWLRYIFDPTSTEPGTDAKRFLKFRVFKELDTNQQVIDDLTALSQTASGYFTAADTKQVENLIKRWRERPFRPFVIARGRHIAFLWRTLFSYLDNLLTWADSLYRRDTRESINEALMLYTLAMKILGRKPKKQTGKSMKSAINFNQFVDQWDDFANFWIDVGVPHSTYVQAYVSELKSIKPRPTSVGMLAFCMPFNDKILNYWDTVEARLFNIRHCRNIEGIERTLPLSDPPIDPELLIRATAAGLDIGSVIAGLYAAPPHYRYGTLANRATELANDVKLLGSALLSAIEKRDVEGLALLRGANEISLLKLVTDLRNLQINEAEKNLESLRASRRSLTTRYYQYQRLMGKKDIKVPLEGETAGEESMLGVLNEGLASNRSDLGLIHEENEVYAGIKAANDWSTAANITKIISGGLHTTAALLASNKAVDEISNASKTVNFLGQASSALGDAFSAVSQAWRSYADQQSMLAGHLRRRDDWAFQSNQTLKELQQIDKQILANQVRIEITKKELSNHIEQLEQAQAIDEVMRSKFTNQQLYEWMSRELSSLYDKTYRLALETSRKAERAAERELGTKSLNVIRHDYWDTMKQGLLAGERLYHDLKRLEVTFLEQNRREFELTKHVSLRRLNPAALIELRSQSEDDDGNKVNRCEFDIPEWLFDLDTPGHFLRRIKSVSVSIPCMVGPYTSINCKLTLLKSSIRHDKNTQPKYDKVQDDPRFTDYYGASEAIVTSTANADTGMFETQLRDERFLPFEGNGAISTWRLELPADYPQFDYSTISDVILSMRYTAREGGLELKNAASKDIDSHLSTPDSKQFTVLLSCKSDFPSEWAKAKSKANEKLIIPISKNLMPYWMSSAELEIKKTSYLKVGIDSELSALTDFDDNKHHIDLGGLDEKVSDIILILYIAK